MYKTVKTNTAARFVIQTVKLICQDHSISTMHTITLSDYGNMSCLQAQDSQNQRADMTVDPDS